MSIFMRAYLIAILFAERSLDNADNDDTSLQDEGWAPEDFHADTLATARRDCVLFQWRNRALLRAAYATGYTVEQAGHDFYFTQAGHGVGYWDRDLGDIGDKLSAACADREFCVFPNFGKLEIE